MYKSCTKHFEFISEIYFRADHDSWLVGGGWLLTVLCGEVVCVMMILETGVDQSVSGHQPTNTVTSLSTTTTTADITNNNNNKQWWENVNIDDDQQADLTALFKVQSVPASSW